MRQSPKLLLLSPRLNASISSRSCCRWSSAFEPFANARPLGTWTSPRPSSVSALPAGIAPCIRQPNLIAFFNTSTNRRSRAAVLDEMAPVVTTDRLSALRAQMKEKNVDIYVVPSGDAHSSEYTAPCDLRRAFITGFTGSSGTAVITQDKAVMATDGRYFAQAGKQLDSNWELLKQGLQDVLTWEEWAAEQSAGGKTVGVDPTILSTAQAKKLIEKIKKAGGAGLVPVTDNLVDLAWGSERPGPSGEPVILLSEKYAGKDFKTKLAEIRKELEKQKSAGFIVSMLDEVAWLFNLRGNDVEFNPVFYAYAIVTQDTVTLYIDSNKLSAEVQTYLKENDIVVKPYNSLFDEVKLLAANALSDGEAKNPKKFTISNKGSWALKLALGEDLTEENRGPVVDAKAIKNETELEGMRQCHIRDGAALIEYFAWLEDQLINQKATLDEIAASDKLEELRKKQEHFVGLSFATISATGPNGAIIHYRAVPGDTATIDPNAIYLCDSGAQYLDGTTDTTRTLHFTTPSAAEKQNFTLVLKGHIALATAVFPKGTTGLALDARARQFLWDEGLDYRHGTGHGVGSYLNVHEGPIGIGTHKAHAEVALSVGNVISNEPGYYEDGSYGIRTENIIMVKEAKTNQQFGDKPFLGFETVTMVPYCRKLIDESLLTAKEKKWLNDYYTEIFEKTKDYFKDDALTTAWLKRETQAF